MRINKCFGTAFLALAVMAAMVSCRQRTVYDGYQSTPVAGWEKNDTLSFSVNRVDTAAVYHATLGLRTTDDYPFTSITLIVEQHTYPSDRIQKDTLNLRLTDDHGNATGKGLSFRQYTFDIGDVSLESGDSVHVRIRHDMKREILPGISDVGYELRRK